MTQKQIVAWRRRDPNIQLLFDRIEKWLRAEVRTNFNTRTYDSIAQQWLEYGALTNTQVKQLQEIIERWIER